MSYMEVIKNECLHESYIGKKTSEILSIDYDENQLLATEFSNKEDYQRKKIFPDVK